MATTLILSDLHLPWQHPNAFAFCCAVYEQYGCDSVASVGDIVDYHNISRHETDPYMPSAMDEYLRAKDEIHKWHSRFPNMLIAEGNHDTIPHRQLKALGIPDAFLKDPNELWGVPATDWKWASRHTLGVYNGAPVYMMHGVGSSCNTMANRAIGAHLVGGHHHSYAGIVYNPTPVGNFWAMTVGCLVDPTSRAFRYFRQQDQLKMPHLGCGVITNGTPHIVPMVLNKKGKWNGEV